MNRICILCEFIRTKTNFIIISYDCVRQMKIYCRMFESLLLKYTKTMFVSCTLCRNCEKNVSDFRETLDKTA